MSEQKGKKASPSALLFWGGLSLGPIGAVLALIIPSAPWTAILVALLGAVVAGRQHILDDRAHRLEVKRLEARDTQSSELRIIGNVSKAPATMPPNRERESEASQ